MHHFTKSDLKNFQPQHNSFVGIDSDGCVFPTMELKQKQCFHKLIIAHWHLEKIEKQLRESAEFVNLYSKYRGQNRFPCLWRTVELLRDRPEVQAAGVILPEFSSLKKFIDSGAPLSNDELEKAAKSAGDAELAAVLQWSKDVNTEIAKTVRNVPPFHWALKSLDKIHRNSDAICVSQTPTEALVREWEENALMSYISIIAGQELGSKAEHLRMATTGRYQAGKVLMIGDAPGDKNAAHEVSAHFFPINPGHEEASWEKFHEEAYDRFLNGTYAGAYETDLTEEFDRLLPDNPPWKISQIRS